MSMSKEERLEMLLEKQRDRILNCDGYNTTADLRFGEVYLNQLDSISDVNQVDNLMELDTEFVESKKSYSKIKAEKRKSILDQFKLTNSELSLLIKAGYDVHFTEADDVGEMLEYIDNQGWLPGGHDHGDKYDFIPNVIRNFYKILYYATLLGEDKVVNTIKEALSIKGIDISIKDQSFISEEDSKRNLKESAQDIADSIAGYMEYADIARTYKNLSKYSDLISEKIDYTYDQRDFRPLKNIIDKKKDDKKYKDNLADLMIRAQSIKDNCEKIC